QGFAVLVVLAFLLVLLTNQLTIMLSVAALGLASLYPFMKRYTHLPQLFLGAAYSMAIPMAFAAQSNDIPQVAWLLYAANMAWTVAYDTLYATVDRDDDLLLGVKPTAIVFGARYLALFGLLSGITLLSLLAAFGQRARAWPAYLGLLAGALYVAWLLSCVRSRSREACSQAFLNNYWFGLIIWAG